MKGWIKYGIAFAVGLLMAWGVLRAEDYALFKEAGETAQQYMILCDACFVPGIFLALAGVLTWLSAKGAFDTISYIVSSGLHLIFPRKLGKMQSLYDYCADKEEKRGGVRLFLLWIGAVFLAAAVVFLLLFTKAEGAGG